MHTGTSAGPVPIHPPGAVSRIRQVAGGVHPLAAGDGPATTRGVGIVRHQYGVDPRAQARAAASRAKAAMMTATRT